MHPLYGPAIFDYNLPVEIPLFALVFPTASIWETRLWLLQIQQSGTSSTKDTRKSFSYYWNSHASVTRAPICQDFVSKETVSTKNAEFSCQKDFEFVQRSINGKCIYSILGLKENSHEGNGSSSWTKPVIHSAATSPMKKPNLKAQQLQAIEPHKPQLVSLRIKQYRLSRGASKWTLWKRGSARTTTPWEQTQLAWRCLLGRKLTSNWTAPWRFSRCTSYMGPKTCAVKPLDSVFQKTDQKFSYIG